jgi:hypothetical protein
LLFILPALKTKPGQCSTLLLLLLLVLLLLQGDQLERQPAAWQGHQGRLRPTKEELT